MEVVKFHAVYYEKCFVCIVMDKYGGGDFIEGMQAHWQMEMEEKSVTVGGDHMAFPSWLCVTRASDTARSTLVVSGLRRRVHQ